MGGVNDVLQDPSSAIDWYHDHEQDFTAVGDTYSALRSVAETSGEGRSGVQFSARFNLGVSPLTIQDNQPTGGVTVMLRAGFSWLPNP